jgi:two-component system, cell cycle response regulator DivK
LAKILIVEDNALNIKLFCDLLAAHGHEPEAVTDSRNALDAARSFSPDLVITDIQLPHVSGLDLIRLIRNDEKLAKTPIMAVTAYSALGDEERIREAGAQAYVSKPISVVRFAQTVDELLKEESDKAAVAAVEDPATDLQESPGPSETGGEESSS